MTTAATDARAPSRFRHVRSGVFVLYGDFAPGMSMPILHPCNPERPTQARVPAVFNPQNVPSITRWLFPRLTKVVGHQNNWAIRRQNTNDLSSDDNPDLAPGSTKPRFDTGKPYTAGIPTAGRRFQPPLGCRCRPR